MGSDDHIHRAGRLTSHSPRELEAMRRCPRLWAWLYPEGHRKDEVPGASALRGITIHAQVARDLQEGTVSHPATAAAIEVLDGEPVDVEVLVGGEAPDGSGEALYTGRIDALTPTRVIDWKTVLSEHGFTGRRPGLQGEIYCRLAGRRTAEVVEIDEYGDWDSVVEHYDGVPSPQLVYLTLAVEYYWDHPAEALGVLCASCEGCTATCKKAKKMDRKTVRELFEALPQEHQAKVLLGLGAERVEDLERMIAERKGPSEYLIRSAIETIAEEEAPAPKAKKAKAAPAPVVEATPAPVVAVVPVTEPIEEPATTAKPSQPAPAPDRPAWLSSDGVRDVLFQIGAAAQEAWAEARRLEAPAGTLAVGGAHMDPVFRATALEGLVSGIGHDLATPESAAAEARVRVREAVAKWNERTRDSVTRRSGAMCDSLIQHWQDSLQDAIASAHGSAPTEEPITTAEREIVPLTDDDRPAPVVMPAPAVSAPVVPVVAAVAPVAVVPIITTCIEVVVRALAARCAGLPRDRWPIMGDELRAAVERAVLGEIEARWQAADLVTRAEMLIEGLVPWDAVHFDVVVSDPGLPLDLLVRLGEAVVS